MAQVLRCRQEIMANTGKAEQGKETRQLQILKFVLVDYHAIE